jgi:hypothetical protein
MVSLICWFISDTITFSNIIFSSLSISEFSSFLTSFIYFSSRGFEVIRLSGYHILAAESFLLTAATAFSAKMP